MSLLVVTSLCTVACVSCAALLLTRSLPAVLARTVRECLQVASDAQVTCDRLEKRAKTHFEAAEAEFDRTERKRASIASKESKLAAQLAAHEIPFENLDRQGQKDAIAARAAQLGMT